MSAEQQTLFDQYILHASEAAKIARQACLETQPLLEKIRDLETNLQIYKLGNVELENQLKAAQKQLENGDQIVYVVLDGDGCIFNRALVQKGRDGGREAAKFLVSKVGEFADTQGVKGQLQIVINIFLNKYGLAKTFNSCGIADEKTFSDFLQGLNAAHSLIQVTDVGAQKEAADAKISQSVRLFSRMASCKLVLAGCTHDGGYAHLFGNLETESASHFGKITLLKSYSEAAFEVKRLGLRTVTFEGLFEVKKLQTYAGAGNIPQTPSRKNSPALGSNNANGSVTPVAGANGFKTPKTVKKALYQQNKENFSGGGDSAAPTKFVQLKPIDPTKALSKQNPPCCNQHYLAPPCLHGDNCKYSHFYSLTPKQLVTLRADAKKSPCANALKGKACPPNCFAGHTCYFGASCRYGEGSNGCRFSRPGMHPPGTKSRTDGAAWRGKDAWREGHAGAAVGDFRDSYGDDETSDEEDSGFETTSELSVD
ncbi:hypothetical protein JCM8547_007465 [Rhodosporidiobolus lusitaniae]